MGYGTFQINGKTYIEMEQTFPMEVAVTVNLSDQRVVLALPGVADFLLKCLTRETVLAGASAARRFRFRFGNSDGGQYYQSGGNGGATDRVIDTLLFGSGQFPFVLCPYIFYSASASIVCEIEDVSNNQPYTIFFAFRGSYLYPAG
jgi:hypothetical protein